jgi:general secretion pathway protein K
MRKNEKGFILVSVIWIAGLLAAVASTFAIAMTLYVKGQANLAGSAKAELAADGLVRLISYELAGLSFEDGARAPVDGWAFRCRTGERDAVLAVQDQGGLIDLNRSSLALLSHILERVAKPGVAAKALAEAVADFRDADNIRFGATTGGAETSLVPEGPPPKNAPFQSVDEIEQVLPASMVDLERLKPVLTIYSRQDGIDIDAAPSALKATLGLDRGGERSLVPLAPSQHKTFAIDAEVVTADGSRFRRVAMVALTRDSRRPFTIMEWRQGSGPIESKTSGNAPRCEAVLAN